jgi:hypothetical protein
LNALNADYFMPRIYRSHCADFFEGDLLSAITRTAYVG